MDRFCAIDCDYANPGDLQNPQPSWAARSGAWEIDFQSHDLVIVLFPTPSGRHADQRR